MSSYAWKTTSRSRRRQRRREQMMARMELREPDIPEENVIPEVIGNINPTAKEPLGLWNIFPERIASPNDGETPAKLPKLKLRKRLVDTITVAKCETTPWRAPRAFWYDAAYQSDVKKEERTTIARIKRNQMGGDPNEKLEGVIIDHRATQTNSKWSGTPSSPPPLDVEEGNKENVLKKIALMPNMPDLGTAMIPPKKPLGVSTQNTPLIRRSDGGSQDILMGEPMKPLAESGQILPVEGQEKGGKKNHPNDDHLDAFSVEATIPADDPIYENWWNIFSQGPLPDQEADNFIQEVFDKYLPKD